MKIKIFLFSLLLIIVPLYLHAQDELLSAKDLLQKISDNFKKDIKDFQANLKWIANNMTQEGTIYFKNPQKLRINFTDPKDQVICTNGYDLWLYIVNLRTVLHQKILDKEKIKTDEGKTETIVNPLLLNPVGLDRFINDYSIEFSETKEKVLYKDNTKVYKLKLIRWRSSKNGFNVVFLTVQDNGLIRRVEGITAAYRKIVLEIDNIKTNTNLGDLFFTYEPPAHATTVENFISNQEETK